MVFLWIIITSCPKWANLVSKLCSFLIQCFLIFLFVSAADKFWYHLVVVEFEGPAVQVESIRLHFRFIFVFARMNSETYFEIKSVEHDSSYTRPLTDIPYVLSFFKMKVCNWWFWFLFFFFVGLILSILF